jgi:hypothetical protein
VLVFQCLKKLSSIHKKILGIHHLMNKKYGSTGQMDMYPSKFRSDSELPLAESMDFHGFSWIFMDFHGFSWIFMDFHGCVCT